MTTRELLEEGARHNADFLDGLGERPVQPKVGIEDLRRALGGPLPQTGSPDAKVLRELRDACEPGLLGSPGPRFFGWVIGGALPAALAADHMVSTWDQNAATYACSPALAVAEEVCGTWLKELLGLPASSSYAFVTGCQMAHVTALAAARFRLLAAAGWDINRRGLAGAPRLRVLSAEHQHETFVRALRLLGIGSDAIECLAQDAQGRLDPHALEVALAADPDASTLVCLQAGDLNTGSFDDFKTICPLAHAHNAWVHVDGAFGLWARLSPAHAHLLEGVELADSWATDGHKWLNVPYDSGFVFVADVEAHRSSMAMDASYVIAAESDGRDQTNWNPEWSRRARSIPTYAAIRALGREGIAEMVARCCEIAKELVIRIGALPGASVVHVPSINQGLLRFLAEDGEHDARTDEIIEAIQDEGTAWFGGATWRGQRVMRVSVCNWQTAASDVERTVEAVRRVLESKSR